MKCVFCGEDTTSSVGKAGYNWSFICQKCKDEKDDELMFWIKSNKHKRERMLQYQAMIMNKIGAILK